MLQSAAFAPKRAQAVLATKKGGGGGEICGTHKKKKYGEEGMSGPT